MSTEESQIQALSTLINGVRVAQRRGCYSLEEACNLFLAIKEFSHIPDDLKNSKAVKKDEASSQKS